MKRVPIKLSLERLALFLNMVPMKLRKAYVMRATAIIGSYIK
jgi:hypothetical protein